MAESLTAGSGAEANLNEDRLDQIRAAVETWVDGKNTRALAVLGARNGVVALHKAYGARTPEKDAESVSVDTMFHTASLSKPVTATAVMVLAERGLLGINRPVKDYFPELKAEGGGKILVRHLLTHTSGYSDAICGPAYQAHRQNDYQGLEMPEQEETEHPLLRTFTHAMNVQALAFEPGKEMAYCNYNYILLAELVRRASRRSFKDFVEQEIFLPLGMDSSRMGISEEELQGIALRGEGEYGRFFDGELWRAPWGHAGVRSTAWDMAVFAQTFLNQGTHGGFRLLSPASVQAMTTNQIPGVGTQFWGWHDEASWGLGWGIQGTERWAGADGVLRSVGSFSHIGATSCQVWVDPPRNLVGVYLSVCLDHNPETDVSNCPDDVYQDMLTSACI